MIPNAIDYRIRPNESLIIKAFAIIAMLVHHLFYDHPEFGNTVVNIGMSGKICVTLFVFASGYGMTASFPKDIKEDFHLIKPLFFVLCKRYAKFYLNYWFVFFIFVPIGIFCFGRSLESAYGEKANLVNSFISDIIGLQSINSYNVTWWFNVIILSLWLLFPFIFLLNRNIITSICLLIFLILNPGDILYALHFLAPGLPDYIIPFTLSVFAAFHISTINKILNAFHPYVVCAISLVIASILLFLRGFPVFESFTSFRVDPFAMVFVVLAVISLCRVTGRKFAFMQYVGKHSMNMYLTHTFIFGYFFHDFIYGFKHPVLIFLVLFMTSLLLSICIEFSKRRIGFYKLQGKVVETINRIGCLVPKEHDNAH